jgi:hypothetical protein
MWLYEACLNATSHPLVHGRFRFTVEREERGSEAAGPMRRLGGGGEIYDVVY